MKNRTTLTAGAVIVVTMMVLSILLVWQRNTNTRLRKELERLRVERVQSDRLTEENERLREENQRLARVKIDGDEMERLRREHMELLRLRGQLSTAKGVLGDKDRQLEDAQSQLNESLQRGREIGRD